jgi:hypothetical protein
VVWIEGMKAWKVNIGVNRKQIHLGFYKDLARAIAVRKEAEEKYYGCFAPTPR